jgi:hypothetical protein
VAGAILGNQAPVEHPDAVLGRRDQEASLFTVIVWRDQAEHAAESLSKANRVVVVGRRRCFVIGRWCRPAVACWTGSPDWWLG